MVDKSFNKRTDKRFLQRLTVRGQSFGSDNDIHSFEGKTQDISLGGLCVKIKKTYGFEIGQALKIRMDLIVSGQPIGAYGSIRWFASSPDPNWPIIMGVNLNNIENIRQNDRWIKMISTV